MPNNQQDKNALAMSGPSPICSDIDLEFEQEMFERRGAIRRVPCPESLERNDAEAWTDWDNLSKS
jgi:hypothetical protein